MENKTIVLYHRSCTDGLVAGYLAWKYFKEHNIQVEAIAVNYNETMPDVTDAHVYIVDFCYPKEVIQEACKIAKSITILDHHETASEWFNGYGVDEYRTENGCNVHIEIIKEFSGCQLTLRYFLNLINEYKCTAGFLHNKRLLDIVKHIGSRDLWIFETEDTLIHYEMVNAMPFTFEQLDYVIYEESEEDYARRYMYAKAQTELKQLLTQQYAKLHELVTFQGYTVPCVNVPANFSSSVGDILSKDNPFAIMYCLNSKKVYVSLRSKNVVVSELAKKYSGGGHPMAAGFSITPEQLIDLLNSKL